MNVDSLRRRRAKKLGVRPIGYTGQRRIFFVLERATRKCPGELALWMQYLEFTKQIKANKKLLKILDEVLRLHPTKPELWIWASQHHISVEADFAAARNCMQAAMRFCPKSSDLWLEYARLEVAYLAKIVGRRKVLGLDEINGRHGQRSPDTSDENMIMLPSTTQEEASSGVNLISAQSRETSEKIKVDPDAILKGAIPRTIFDDAMKIFNNSTYLAEQFFNLFWEYRWIEASKELAEDVCEHMQKTAPQAPETLICKSKTRLQGTSAQSHEFPSFLLCDLQEIKNFTGKSPVEKADLMSKFMLVLTGILEKGDLDPDIRTVILSSLRTFSFAIKDVPSKTKIHDNKLDELVVQHSSISKYLIA